jgi:hypothetical protein
MKFYIGFHTYIQMHTNFPSAQDSTWYIASAQKYFAKKWFFLIIQMSNISNFGPFLILFDITQTSALFH